jgi:hypothetical protein
MGDLQLGSVIVGPRGNKSAPLSRGNKPVTCKLPPTTAPFNAGVFGDQLSTRLNLELHVGQEEYQKFLNEIDEFCIKALAKDSAQYFPKKKTEEEIRAIFKPSITVREKDGVQYEATMRTKINTSGIGALRCWTSEKALRGLPEDWRRTTIEPIVTAKSIYFMQGIVGVTFQIDDCVVVEKSEECPF